MQVSAVWACVQYITNSVCSLPIEFYRKTDDGREELGRHYLTDLFYVSPNSLMKPRDFRKAMTMQLCLWSNAYAEIFYSGERPVALVPLRQGRMTPYIDDKGDLTYHYQMEQGVRVYSQKSIFHMKGFGSDGVVGLERSQYARKTLGLSVSADTYAAKQFANGGNTGGGFIQFDDFLTPEQRKSARSLYENMHETAFNKGKLMILEGGSKYVNPGLNPDTMQMIETRKMQLGEIARFFGVPEVMIGASSSGANAWPASFEQQLLSFLTFTLQDYVDEWEHAIKYSLVPAGERDSIIVDHDVTGFIKMDSQAKANIQSTWVQNGLKSRNEIRKINNDPPVEGGDELTIQVNLAPVSDPANDTEVLAEDPEAIKRETDAYGAAVRAGVITPQPEDEEYFRNKSGLPSMSSSVQGAWVNDGRVRRPITLQSGVAFDATQEQTERVAKADLSLFDNKTVFNIAPPEQKAPIFNVAMPPSRMPKAPVVNVTVPEQAPPTVKVEAPVVNVEAPDVTVNNDVKTPEVRNEVNVEVPTSKRDVKFKRNRKGDITSAEIDG
jgi:HK97 family phage portal protein